MVSVRARRTPPNLVPDTIKGVFGRVRQVGVHASQIDVSAKAEAMRFVELLCERGSVDVAGGASEVKRHVGQDRPKVSGSVGLVGR